jgi:hypothetical protein
MSEWGRKEYKDWPSRRPVWTWGAFLVAFVLLLGGLAYQYARQWTFAEREYLGNYMLASTLGRTRDKGHYRFVAYLDKKGNPYIASGDEIERVKMPDGRPGYELTEAGVEAGAVRLQIEDGVFSNAWMRQTLGHVVYGDRTVWEYVQWPVYGALGVFVVLLFYAVPKDRKRALVWKHGRRLRGPEVVTTAEFNEKLGRKKGLNVYVPDGLALINENQSWGDRTFNNKLSRWVRIPREREAMHMLIVGDSGHGKSATVRQVLSQIWERGETAIVYDPAMEYLPQFYDPKRGDVILNPLDGRGPFWTPSDEVTHEAEALTLAASLFPDQDPKQRFFVDAPRKILAHLLSLKPTPEELTYWMAHEVEIDRRVKDTPYAAMLGAHGSQQRSGVLGSLNMVADAFKLLPKESETKQRWSTAAWAKERKGWVFITSKPTVRERLRPLISLWLDLLVLRLMDDGSTGKRKTWFVFDELASLQRLPQLTTAITESRKSNSPMVLGFQGKAQIEALYGHVAEAMLSQPATKIYLKTSEPHAAEWISKAIGEVEIERYRETRTHGQFPQSRNSESQQRDISREPLVMASEISGLDPLHGYLKHGNYVVRMRVPYLQLEAHHEKFVERKIEPSSSNGYEAAPPKQEPVAAQQMELKPAQEQQQHFFE